MVDEQDTVAVRLVTPVEKLSEAMGSTYGRIMEYLGSEGIQPSGPPFAVYHNMDMTALDVEIGIPRPLAGGGARRSRAGDDSGGQGSRRHAHGALRDHRGVV